MDDRHDLFHRRPGADPVPPQPPVIDDLVETGKPVARVLVRRDSEEDPIHRQEDESIDGRIGPGARVGSLRNGRQGRDLPARLMPNRRLAGGEHAGLHAGPEAPSVFDVRGRLHVAEQPSRDVPIDREWGRRQPVAMLAQKPLTALEAHDAENRAVVLVALEDRAVPGRLFLVEAVIGERADRRTQPERAGRPAPARSGTRSGAPGQDGPADEDERRERRGPSGPPRDEPDRGRHPGQHSRGQEDPRAQGNSADEKKAGGDPHGTREHDETRDRPDCHPSPHRLRFSPYPWAILRTSRVPQPSFAAGTTSVLAASAARRRRPCS